MAKPPPPLRDLFPRINSFPTLLAAYRKASKGKRYRTDVLAFAANLEADVPRQAPWPTLCIKQVGRWGAWLSQPGGCRTRPAGRQAR
jgi:hypothetical protein